MTTAHALRYSYEEYLRALEDSSIRLEYCAGIIYAMAGGTLAHAELCANAIRLFGQALLGRCTVLSSDAKIRVETSDFSGFPDLSVVCGERRTSAIDANALTNPVVLVEVTSRSTEEYDRGEKLLHYQQLPSVRAVVFVSHRDKRVTIVERQGGAWNTRDVVSGEGIRLNEPALSVDVDELYGSVALEAR